MDKPPPISFILGEGSKGSPSLKVDRSFRVLKTLQDTLIELDYDIFYKLGPIFRVTHPIQCSTTNVSIDTR